MNQNIYIVISIISLLILAAVFAYKLARREVTRLSPQAALAFSFIVAGIAFGENRLLGYGLMGAGVVLAILDAMGQIKGRGTDKR